MPQDFSQLSSGGITAVVIGGDHQRFWINFNKSGGTWQGGHTAPATGILPASSGTFRYAASNVMLYDGANTFIGSINGFNGQTTRGDTGNGHIEDPPSNFSWKAV